MNITNNKDAEFYIWGAYWRGQKIYEDHNKNINIVGFIDATPEREGKIFSELPIFNASILKNKNSKNIKVIVAYHSSYAIKDELAEYGLYKNIDWFDYKYFSSQLNYEISQKIMTNHIFLSIKNEQEFLSIENLCKQVDLYFQWVDNVNYFTILEDNWIEYNQLNEFFEHLSTNHYFEKIGMFFLFVDSSTIISDEHLLLFQKYNIVLRLSNYKKIGCNTKPLLLLIERLDQFNVEYYLMFAVQEDKRKYVPGAEVKPFVPYSFSVSNYDYPNGEIKDIASQYFLSTCDGEIRTLLKNKKLYYQKTLDLCTYLPVVDFEEMDNFSLEQPINKLEFLEFLIGNKNKKRATRDLKLCFVGLGLGNQVFQYIFKRYIEETTKEKVIFEDTFFSYQADHNGSELKNVFPNSKVEFLSDYFSPIIFKQVATIEKRFRMFIGLLINQEEDVLALSEDYGRFSHSIEENTSKGKIYEKSKFYPEISKENYPFICYGGYCFQSNWLFKSPSLELLLKELEFPVITKKIHIDYFEQIQSTESVAVHIRRGDSLNVSWRWIGLEFYRKSILTYRNEINNKYNIEPTYFMFSDDLVWCKENRKEIGFIEADNVVFVDGNIDNGENYRDLQLMSLCQHMIISNSTFSFFASLINRNKTYIKPFEVFDQIKDTIDLEMLPNGIYK